MPPNPLSHQPAQDNYHDVRHNRHRRQRLRVLTGASALTLFLALGGCHREPVPQHPSGTDPVASRSQDSVAAPLASLPAPDAAMAPAQPAPKATTTDTTGGPSQASQSGLTKEQENSAMPLAGQSNNHSTPAPTAPSAASDSPAK